MGTRIEMSRCLILLILPALVHGNKRQAQYIRITQASGHASLVEPPSRAAMNLYGFPQNPVSYSHLIFTKTFTSKITCLVYVLASFTLIYLQFNLKDLKGFYRVLKALKQEHVECYIWVTLTFVKILQKVDSIRHYAGKK